MEIKLYKRPDSPYYWMTWHYMDTLYRESTKTTKKRDAAKIARHKERLIIDGFTGHENTSVVFEDMAKWHIDDMEVNKRKSVSRVKNSIDNLSKQFSGKRVAEITKDEIERYINKRLLDGRKNATINRELSALRRMFRLGVQKRKIHKPPTITLLEEDNIRTDFFEHDEFLKLYDNMAFHIRPVMLFAYKSGWRKETILSLKWNDCDIENAIVWLPGSRTKNKKGVTFIIKDEFLLVYMKFAWDAHKYGHWKTDYIFPNSGGTDRIYDFRKEWRKAFERAKLKYKTFHSLRRSFARNAIRAGVSQKVVMEMGGWKTQEIFNRYDITSEKDYREAQDKMELFLETQKPEKKGDTSKMKEHYGVDHFKLFKMAIEDEDNDEYDIRGKDIKTLKEEAKANGCEMITNMDDDYIVQKK